MLGTGCAKSLMMGHGAQGGRLEALPEEGAARHKIHNQVFGPRGAAAVDPKLLDFSSTKGATWGSQVGVAPEPNAMPCGAAIGAHTIAFLQAAAAGTAEAIRERHLRLTLATYVPWQDLFIGICCA